MSKKHYTFPCNRWLARSEDDGHIIREMAAEGDDIKKPQSCSIFSIHLYVYIVFFYYNKKLLKDGLVHLYFFRKSMKIVVHNFWPLFLILDPQSYILLIPHFAVTKYRCEVYTGDRRGAGTDADVFLMIYGEQGDTGERPLLKSANNRNKFERGKVSTIMASICLKNPSMVAIASNCCFNCF